MKKRFFLAVAAAMTLAGCGSHDQGSTSSNPANKQQSQAVIQQAKQNAAAQAAIPGGHPAPGTQTAPTGH